MINRVRTAFASHFVAVIRFLGPPESFTEGDAMRFTLRLSGLTTAALLTTIVGCKTTMPTESNLDAARGKTEQKPADDGDSPDGALADYSLRCKLDSKTELFLVRKEDRIVMVQAGQQIEGKATGAKPVIKIARCPDCYSFDKVRFGRGVYSGKTSRKTAGGPLQLSYMIGEDSKPIQGLQFGQVAPCFPPKDAGR